MGFVSRKEMEKRHKKAAKAGIAIITREAAKNSGLKRYFDGKLCPHNHISERYVGNGKCIQCHTKSVVTWRKESKDTYLEGAARYQRERYNNDVEFHVRARARWMITNAMKRMGYKKGSRTEDVLGCSWSEFKSHIERQFLPGMTWENRHLWHIDHIVPISSAESDVEAEALNHHTNLRPLWSEENRAKAARNLFLI